MQKAGYMTLIDIKIINTIAITAGDIIMEIYSQDFAVEFKTDKSPLTEADKRAHQHIYQALKSHYPEIPILSEEDSNISYENRRNWDKFWLVDPLDGTKEFIKKNGEFTVNIALIHKHVPIAGVVYAPVPKTLYYAIQGEGAYKVENKAPPLRLPNKNPACNGITVVGSRSHLSAETQAYIDKLKAESGKAVQTLAIGSSLKLCMVAEGRADVYPRLAPTMEWDIAAAHAIVNEAGKSIFSYPSGEELTYNKEVLKNDWFVVK